MFQYPLKAKYGKVLPKTKIYENAKPSPALRNKFVSEVNQIVWQYKLSPETINLPTGEGVLEIQIFTVTLKSRKFDLDILRCIDQVIPHPIFFEMIHDNRGKTFSAYKRPHESIPGKWVVADYFESAWQPLDVDRLTLPMSLNMSGLYERMLQSLMPFPAQARESLKDQVERMGRIRIQQRELLRMEKLIRKEQQFNRKVELHGQLRKLKKDLNGLGIN